MLQNSQKFRVLWHGRTKLTEVARAGIKMLYPYLRYLWHWCTKLTEVPGTGMKVVQNLHKFRARAWMSYRTRNLGFFHLEIQALVTEPRQERYCCTLYCTKRVFTLNGSFCASASSTPSVRADSYLTMQWPAIVLDYDYKCVDKRKNERDKETKIPKKVTLRSNKKSSQIQ